MNKEALELLKNNNYSESQALLKRCECSIVRRLKTDGNNNLSLKLLSITLNNMACWCKK